MNLLQSIFYLFVLTLFTNVNAADDKKQDAKCLLPMDPGPCRMSLNRFYYNANTDACEEFKFGGCMGNDNKFGFKQTCEDACKKSVTTAGTTASGTAGTTASGSAGTTATGTAEELKRKQLNPNTLKTLTSVVKETPTTTTTLKPKTTRRTTTVKSRTTTPPIATTSTTTTQKSKPQK